jgi:hypothetical protein
MSKIEFLTAGEDPQEYLDGLELVPPHDNDIGDWCPYGDGSTRTADGTCPQYCEEADDIAGVDAGRDVIVFVQNEEERPPS